MPSRRIGRSRLFAALAATSAFVGLAVAAGCGSDAKGVTACRKIEEQRCDLAPKCAAYAEAHELPVVTTEDDVASCKEFYRDQCLNGVESGGADGKEPTDAQTSSCVAALKAMLACAGAPNLVGCAGVELAVGVDPSKVSACGVLLGGAYPGSGSAPPAGVELLAACAFVKAPEPADAGPVVDAGGDADAASDAGDDAADASGE
jgi:hypothetical protein